MNATTPSKNTLTDDIKNISDNLELYSDDSRIVFKNGKSTLVFGYKGNEITSYTVYIDSENALKARYALSTLLTQKDDKIKQIYFIVILIHHVKKEVLKITTNY